MTGCQFKEICVTPNWHPKSKAKYIKDVCNRPRACQKCTSYESFVSNGFQPGTPLWTKIANYIQKRGAID